VSKNQHSAQDLRVSQNFLTSRAVLRRIVRLSSITKDDCVVEIGAGKGHITRQLGEIGGQVLAVEYDSALAQRLTRDFAGNAGVRIIHADFLRWNLPKTPYKVFANIPFSRTSEILRKLTQAKNPPQEAWLVMEKGAAKRFLGKPQESAASLLCKPWFDAEIVYHFRREDFHPAPRVDTVLLYLTHKKTPDIPMQQRGLYTHFITDCLHSPQGAAKHLTKKQISTALRLAGLPQIGTARETLYIQWLCLFRCYAERH